MSWAFLDEAVARLREMPGVRPNERVVVAMSGGVDSSVAAILLHRAGYEVIGVSMHLFDKPDHGGSTGRCCTLDDFQDARRVAQQAGFPHYVVNFGERFRAAVMDPFADSYLRGETPSPCILCNKFLKFDSLIETAETLDARLVATGHYAQVLREEGGYRLLKAEDPVKDQSYFLFPHTQVTLARTLFPLGFLAKVQVRELAERLGLPVAGKAESQEICFVTQNRYDSFIEAHKPGPLGGEGRMRHVDGRDLGAHNGFWRFTVGQRKGLGIAHPVPLYVTDIDPGTRTVWVGEESHLYVAELEAHDATWCRESPEGPFRCTLKLRSRSPEASASAEPLADGGIRVVFDEPQRAVTPGQAVVFYRGAEVLGGAWIRRAGQRKAVSTDLDRS